MTRTVVPVLRAAVLVAFALVLSHQAVFLVRYGSIYGEALAHAGHGQAWSDAVVVVLGGGVLLLGASILGLRRLALQFRGRAPEITSATDLRPILRRWLATATWLSIAVVALLTIQENLEHAATGFGLPGPAILLSQEYPFALLVAGLVALLVALVATLISWRRDVLIARIAAAGRAWLASRTGIERPAVPWVDHRHAAIVGHHIVGRAPPSPSAA